MSEVRARADSQRAPRGAQAPVAPPARVDLVLVGFGGVARRFVELLEAQRDRLPFPTRVVGVATARHGCALAPGGLDAPSAARGRAVTACHDPASGRPPRDAFELIARAARAGAEAAAGRRLVVVENTPYGNADGQPGLGHVRAALDAGADVITANKGPAAFAWPELRDRAAAAGAGFRFEGAVLDGLPVFSLVRDTLPGVAIRAFRGIVNTTTNHVLSALDRGRSLDEAVAEMQAAGIAEADASHDVDGWDAAAKTAILANVLLDADITPHDVARTGLRAVDPAVARAARAAGRAVKLVASAARSNGQVTAAVRPVELPAGDPLARLDDTAKGLSLDTDLLGTIQITKSASGPAHTAYALVADLVSLHRP